MTQLALAQQKPQFPDRSSGQRLQAQIQNLLRHRIGLGMVGECGAGLGLEGGCGAGLGMEGGCGAGLGLEGRCGLG